MKTTVSIPDDIFRRADQLAKRFGVSRSELYSRALREIIARHSTEEVTAALDRIHPRVWGPNVDSATSFTREMARRRLGAIEW